MDNIYQLWGKTSRAWNSESYHPALYHMIDAGNVARLLLQKPASPRWMNVFASTLDLSRDQVESDIPFFVALHDIGKVSSDFQEKVPQQKERLAGNGFQFGKPLSLHHTKIGQIFLLFQSDEILPKEHRLLLRDVVGGHHGVYSWFDQWQAPFFLIQRDEPPGWNEMRQLTFHTLASIFKPRLDKLTSNYHRSAAILALTGFTTLCDWLASDEDAFQLSPDIDPAEYFDRSLLSADQSLRAKGFYQEYTSTTSTHFNDLYPDISNPRPLQRAIEDIPASTLSKPVLAIIEAPTGEGKTEAALYLAHRIAAASGTNELYYALPTTATSNQMFHRVKRYLQEGLGLQANVKLVHGQALLAEHNIQVTPMENGQTDPPVDILDWFSPKKLSLLSGFGVGTVDQAELGALNVRHNSLRLSGLAGKVVIIDEVHAYDTYMTTIIERLLSWLSALGTSVILLSATLPKSKLQLLLSAYSPDTDTHNIDQSAYPSILISSVSTFQQITPNAYQSERRIICGGLTVDHSDPALMAKLLVDSVAEGGCSCWITNTVARAQQLYQAVLNIASADIDTLLIHSRYTVQERTKREKVLSEKYGPSGSRPTRGIVIGTQVLEQSLDLDFDYMISDLAPIDLLLQRAGRLHRHSRNRPPGHPVPRLDIAISLNTDGELMVRGDAMIYSEFLLRQTWLILKDRSEISLPRDYRILVESVYGSDIQVSGKKMEAAWAKLQREESSAEETANQRLVPTPERDNSFCGKSTRLTFEESETKAGWIIAQTRLGQQSITVLPMEVLLDGHWQCGGGLILDPNLPIDRNTQLALLRQCIRVSYPEIIHVLTEQPRPPVFDTALLQEVYPLWISKGQVDLNTGGKIYRMILDEELGLIIERMKG